MGNLPPKVTVKPVPPGTNVGREYEVKGVIGEGSFAEVLLVVNQYDKKQYALKKIAEPLDDYTKELAFKEAESLRSLQHETIVQFRDFFSISEKNVKYLCLVMEFCEYGDLKNYMKFLSSNKQKIPIDLIMYWFIKLCEGFEYFHSKNIIHRDIKPENLFITSDKKVKIGDFGVARILKPKEVADTFVGTLGYIAPEVSFGKGYDQKADIWSLGCILFEAATMRLISDIKIDIARVKDPSVLICKSVKEPALRSLLSYILELDPQKRPNANEILRNSFIIAWKHLLFGGKPNKELMNSDTYWIGVCSALKSDATNVQKRAFELIRLLQLKELKQSSLGLRILSNVLEVSANSKDQNVVESSLEMFSTFLKDDETAAFAKGTAIKNPTRSSLQKKQRQLFCIEAHKKLIQILLENPKKFLQVLKFLSQLGYRNRKIQEDISALDKLWVPLAKTIPKIGIILARWFAFYNDPDVLKPDKMDSDDLYEIAMSRIVICPSEAPQMILKLGMVQSMFSRINRDNLSIPLKQLLWDWRPALSRVNYLALCTQVLKSSYIIQERFLCSNCHIVLCKHCAIECHKNHKIMYSDNVTNAFCTCSSCSTIDDKIFQDHKTIPTLAPSKSVWQKGLTMEFKTSGIVDTEGTKIRTEPSFSSTHVSVAQRKQLIYPIMELNENQESETLSYFEIKINSTGLLGFVVIGISVNDDQLERPPGHYKHKFGVGYASNGNLFVCNDKGTLWGPGYTSSDTVGVGVTKYRQIYFTKNGIFQAM